MNQTATWTSLKTTCHSTVVTESCSDWARKSGDVPEGTSVDMQRNNEAEKNLEYLHVAWADIKPVLHHTDQGRKGVDKEEKSIYRLTQSNHM
jgi:uncharacterized protein YbdZ (MbtH family)